MSKHNLSNSAASPVTFATEAFKLWDEHKATGEAAPQTMAYALRLFHADYVTQGGMRLPGKNGEASSRVDVPAWDSIHKGGDAKRDFIAAIQHSLNMRFVPTGKDESFKQQAARQTGNNVEKSHALLIGRSIPFAAALVSRGVPMENFKPGTIGTKKGKLWHVPYSMLAEKGWIIQEANKLSDLRALDGKSLIAKRPNSKGEMGNANGAVASMAQVLRAVYGAKAAPKAKGADQNKTEASGVVLSNGKTVPADFQKLVLEAARLIKDVAQDGEGVAPISAFDKPMREAMSAISAFYADAVEAQSKAAEAKALAAKAEADRVKAAQADAKAKAKAQADEARKAEREAAYAAKVDAARAARKALREAEADDQVEGKVRVTQAMRDHVARLEAAAGLTDAS